jgi:tight adherence protein B
LRREVRAALAGPKASAKLVTLLPVVAIGFGVVLGFETAAVLLGNPLGIVCLLVGAALLWAGARWNRALAAKAAPPTASPGLELDLLAIAMSSGTSIDGAVAVTGRAIATHLPGAASARHDIAATVRLATQAGAPVAELLRAEAFRQRRAARAEGAVRAAALSVRLMIPLGVCILPAFVLLGVAPLMISVVTGTLGGVR